MLGKDGRLVTKVLILIRMEYQDLDTMENEDDVDV